MKSPKRMEGFYIFEWCQLFKGEACSITSRCLNVMFLVSEWSLEPIVLENGIKLMAAGMAASVGARKVVSCRFYCSSASTDAYFGSHVPPLVPPLIYISIFQNYNVLAPCGYEYYCLKAIFDDFRYHAYRLGKIAFFRATRWFWHVFWAMKCYFLTFVGPGNGKSVSYEFGS